MDCRDIAMYFGSMRDETAWQYPEQQTRTIEDGFEEERYQTIEDIDTAGIELRPLLKFAVAFATGAFFFLVPVPWQGQVTVPFDIVVSAIVDTAPRAVGVYALVLLFAGGTLTTIAELWERGIIALGDGVESAIDLSYWKTSRAFWALRVIGAVLGPVMFFEIGPVWLHVPAVGGQVWGIVILSVATIIPIGAVFINLFVELGGLEFVGTLARPVMRPLFNLPGRAALDSIASWIGSYSVGLYVTRNVFDRGEYNKRDVFVICSCFATVSIGFVGVVAATVDLLSLFPVIFVSYLVCMVICGVILVRVPPLSRVPEEYITEPNPEVSFVGSPHDYWRFALSEAVAKSKTGTSIVAAARQGFIDGLKLSALILGTILSVGLAALLLVNYTDVFAMISRPLVPVIDMLGIPNAGVVATATVVGIVDMFVPALLVVDTHPMARFFVAVLCITQLIFFSAVAPMMMDMFTDIPIRFRDLVVLFALRTAILLPVIAAITHIVAVLGLL